MKCDLCSNKATKFASPLGNPDEPKLCEKHFKEYCKRLNGGIKTKEENFYTWRKTGLAAFLSYIAKAHPKQLEKYFQEWMHSHN